MSETPNKLDEAVRPIHEAAERLAKTIEASASDPYLQDAAIRVGISSAVWKMHDIYRHHFNEDWMLATMVEEFEKQLEVLRHQVTENNNA
jgi:hypothetical protein